MSVDPQAMLQQLEADEANRINAQQATDDPEALLNQLEAENKSNPELFNKSKEVESKKNLLGQMFDAFKQNAESPSLSKTVFKFIAGGFIDDSGKVVKPVEGMPKEILERGIKGQATAINQGLKETGQGLAQMSFDVLEGAGIAPKGLTEYYTNLSEEQRKQFEKDFNDEFGSVAKFNFSRGTGKALPVLAIAPLGVGSTIPTTILKGTALTSAIAGSEFIPENSEQDRKMEALKGAGWGLAGSVLLNILPGIQNFFKRRMKAAFNTQFAKRGAKLGEETGINFSATQLTDDPAVRAIEDIAKNTIAGQRTAGANEAKQVGRLLNFWNTTMKKIDKLRGKEPIARAIHKTFIKTLGNSSKGTGLLGVRATQATKDFAAVDKATNGKRIINLNGFVKKSRQLIDQWRNSDDIHKVRAARELIKKLKKTASRDGSGKRIWKVGGKKMQDMLNTYGSAAKGSGRLLSEKVSPNVQTQLGKALFSQLNADLNVAIKSGVKGANELKLARDNYARNSAEINKLTDSMLGAVFNKKKMPPIETAVETILKQPASEARSTMALLSKTKPSIAAKIRRLSIEDVLLKSKFRTTANEPIFKPGNMLQLDAKKQREVFSAIFSGDKKAKTMVEKGLEITQRIMMDNLKASGGGVMMKITQAAGVAASMDKTFQARLAAELLTPKLISKYIQTGEGLKALLTLSKPYNASKYANALIKLNNIRKEQSEADNGN